ncbi:MAG: 50S ribosomal protein L5 [Candidatus Omnitrophica bacterium]|nr:50S ribosomal protein L5 [Candidatus Omnitrophota bacterium]
MLERYRREMVPALMKTFGRDNPYQVPRVTKVVVNMGVGAATQDPKFLDLAAAELAQITGQRPLITRSKKAISNFKIKQHQPIGCKVTLRGARMYEFLDRLLNVAMPRIRDFRGVSTTAFDRGGNYTFGLAEQVIFPEVDADKMQRVQGMDVTICTTARTTDEARALLAALGMPFAKAS